MKQVMGLAAGLAAGLIAALTLCPIPPPHHFSTPELFVKAAEYVLAIAIATVLAARITAASRGAWGRLVLAAIWFAPLLILVIDRSPLAAVPLIALSASATALLGTAREPPAPSSDLRLLRQFPSGIVTACCVQLALVEALLDHSLVAAALLSAGAAVLAWRATAIDPRAHSTGRRAAGIIAAALALVIVGLFPYRAVVRGAASGAGNGSADADAGRNGDYPDGALADTYRGVILLPEVQQHVTLIPPLPALTRDPFRENKKTLEIPFFGVYWFFRRPDARPPKDSVQMRGTPSALTFRSHDQRPLVMEAHQSLGTPFRISCCRAVELSITNRDRTPQSVSIELILVNTFDTGHPFQSLGKLPVQSIFHMGDKGAGVNEVLEFPIPPAPAIRQWDEFTIRFHRPFLLARESANVAIDGFTLTPR
ncbi:MAG TPA: hypothetical protein VMG40_20725 [Bryobacteraceae bacterium]|nr:hypothetical protein [Bryobacteraceae bacterium]